MEFGKGRWYPEFNWSPGIERRYDQGLDMQAEDFDVLLLHLPPFDQAAIYRRWLAEEPGLRSVVYTTWECDRLPPWWTRALTSFDLVLVPSEFNRQSFLASGVNRPIEVVPHIARQAEPIQGGSFGEISDDDFIFYTIGSWLSRKAMEKTIRTYLETFSADEPVALIVKTDPVDQVAIRAHQDGEVENPPKPYGMTWWTVAKILAEFPRPAKLHLIAKTVPQTVIDQLHTRGDCFVSLAYGEGWGLGSFDAGLFGNPSVITGWGGQLDFLGQDYPLLVDYELEPTTVVAPDIHRETSDDQFWACANTRHAGKLMRWVFENQEDARELGADLKQKLSTQYTPDRVCSQLARLLNLDVRRDSASPSADYS